MWTDEGPLPSRMDGVDYYHKLQCEGEFLTRSGKNLIENEIQRRIARHKMADLMLLENRRKRLADLVQCERRADLASCRQSLKEDRGKNLAKLLEKAEIMKEKARKHNEAIAQEKYMQQRLLRNGKVRQAMDHFHRMEIAKDQLQTIRLKDLKEQEDLKADAWISSQPTHFQEQLDREELEAQKHVDAQKHFADENLAWAAEKVRNKVEGKLCRLKEEQARLKEIIEKDAVEDTHNRQMREVEYRKQLEDDMIEHQNRKVEQARTDRLVDKLYQLPSPRANPEEDCRVKAALRQEYLHFLNYNKKVRKDEECFEKDIDRRYQTIADEMHAVKKERNCHAYARAKEQAKRIVEEQKDMESKRKEEKAKERAIYVASAQELAKQREEIEKKIREETLKQRNAVMEYRKSLHQQIVYNQERRVKYELCEKEREAKSMLRAEDNERQVEKLIEGDMSKFPLHPWRKHMMGIN